MPFVPVTATILFGLLQFNFEENSASNFLGFLFFKYKILLTKRSLRFSDIIILDPLEIASLTNLFPSRLFPFMAKKTSFALKQLLPEENPKTGTKYIVRKPTKGMKVSEKLRLKKYDPVLKKHVWFIEKKMPPHSK